MQSICAFVDVYKYLCVCAYLHIYIYITDHAPCSLFFHHVRIDCWAWFSNSSSDRFDRLVGFVGFIFSPFCSRHHTHQSVLDSATEFHLQKRAMHVFSEAARVEAFFLQCQKHEQQIKNQVQGKQSKRQKSVCLSVCLSVC